MVNRSRNFFTEKKQVKYQAELHAVQRRRVDQTNKMKQSHACKVYNNSLVRRFLLLFGEDLGGIIACYTVIIPIMVGEATGASKELLGSAWLSTWARVSTNSASAASEDSRAV
jgi:hypothetical protein